MRFVIDPGRIRFAVLGDSIGSGTGARHRDGALGARLVRALAGEGFAVDLHVLAVPGATSRDLAVQVERARALGTDLGIVVIGADDLARDAAAA